MVNDSSSFTKKKDLKIIMTQNKSFELSFCRSGTMILWGSNQNNGTTLFNTRKIIYYKDLLPFIFWKIFVYHYFHKFIA